MGLLTGTVATTLMRTLPPLANMQKREQKHVEE
jgi:hypothetical protein